MTFSTAIGESIFNSPLNFLLPAHISQKKLYVFTSESMQLRK